MTNRTLLHFIDPSSRNRAELARIGFNLGYHAEVYGDTREFAQYMPRDGIVIARDNPEEGGIAAMLDRLGLIGIWLPAIAMDATPTAAQIVKSIKAGALDFLALPLQPEQLKACIDDVSNEAIAFSQARKRMIEARDRIANLSAREREVLDWLAEGSSNRVIARELAISPRTVEIHRANMMNTLGARHAAEAVRLRLEAELDNQPRRASQRR